MTASDAEPGPGPDPAFPRVPAYAWTWLQRSRPVLAEAARQLTGGAPTPGFVESLRRQFDADPFVRDILIDVIAQEAFGGRAPTRRPAGTSWDRGLTWWAAALAGLTPAEFEARSGAPPAQQSALFDPGPRTEPAGPAPVRGAARGSRRPVSAERVALARALRELIAAADGDQVPVTALRQLLADLES
jgi:hypothetical protein